MDRAGFNTAHSSYCPCCFSTISSPDQTDPGFGAGAVVPHSFGGPYRNFSPPPVHSPGMPQTTDGSNGNQRSWFNNPYDTQSDHGALTAVQSSKKQISFDVSHDHLPPSGRKSQRPQSILKKSRNTPKYTKGPQSEPQIQFAGASSLKSHGVGAIEALGPISNWSNNCYTFDNTLGFSASNAGSSSGRASLLGQGLLQCGFPAPGRASISGQGILQRGPAAPHNPMKPSGQGFLQPCSPACTPTKSSASGQGFLQSCAPAPHNTNGSGEGSAQNNNDPSFQKALQAFQGSWNLFIDTPPPEYMKTLLAQAIAHNINIQRFTENGEIDERALADFIYDSAPTCQVLLSGMSMNVTPDEITAAIHEGALQSIYFEASMSWVKEGDLEVEVTFKTRHAAERFLQRGISKQILIRGEQVQCEWSAKRISEVKPWEKDQTRILQVCGPDTHVSNKSFDVSYSFVPCLVPGTFFRHVHSLTMLSSRNSASLKTWKLIKEKKTNVIFSPVPSG